MEKYEFSSIFHTDYWPNQYIIFNMKSRFLALRVTSNSVFVIFGVYALMQTTVFFRDSIILGTSAMWDFIPVVVGFLLGTVLPPAVIFGVFLFARAWGFQKVSVRLDSGETLSAGEAERVRSRIIGFKYLVLSVNVLGFTLGYLIDLVASGKLAEILTPHRFIVLLANICAAYVLSSCQTALNNITLASLRDRLGITAIGERKREMPSHQRQIKLTLVLVLYALLVMQYNQRDLTVYHSWSDEVLSSVVRGEVSLSSSGDVYRTLVKERLFRVSTRNPAIADTLMPPWEGGLDQQGKQHAVFFLLLAQMTLICALVQVSVSLEQRSLIQGLTHRIADVVGGGGDLTKRLSLRSMDDFGELAGLVNRLLDEFREIVIRIGSAAERTRKGSVAIDAMLRKTEDLSRQVAEAVTLLRADLEKQVAESRMLADAVSGLQKASVEVKGDTESQHAYIEETSSLMKKMSECIEAVRKQSREAGELTAELALQGKDSGSVVLETRSVIESISESNDKVLGYLGILNKIAADTNLLAMNAAIEAAHAGEKGAGFAVVADEVRNLSATSASQTKAIKELLGTLSARVSDGVEKARSSGKILTELVEGLQNSARVSGEVVRLMDVQADGSKAVGGSLARVVEVSSGIGERMKKQGEKTARMAGQLENALSQISGLVELSNHQVAIVESLEDSFEWMRKEVDENAASINTLHQELGRFRV